MKYTATLNEWRDNCRIKTRHSICGTLPEPANLERFDVYDVKEINL